MSSLRYPILQSGFIGLSESGLTKELPKEPTFSDTILFTHVNKEYDNLFYNAEITDMFNEWQTNASIIKSFGFRERLLRQAFSMLQPSLIEWLSFQSMKPGFTNIHKQLLVKMCSWMSDTPGAPELSSEPLKWINLLGPSQGNIVKFTIHDTIAAKSAMSTVSSVQRWVSKDSGYESLMVYLYIIFGRRVGHTQKTGLPL